MQLLKNTISFLFSKKDLKNPAVAACSFDPMVLSVISVAFLVGYAALIFFYHHWWKRLPAYTPSALPSTVISVIVAARNEEHTLPLLIGDLQAQTYPSHLFEVILVNDFSTDNTAAAAATLPHNFRMIKPPGAAEQSSKKKAIAAGIATANGELLLITDADCRVGKNWISTMASFYRENNAAFIAAPVKYEYQPSLVQALQMLDFVTLQGITAASVAAGFHTMCNGANLAYTKGAFAQVNGFEGIDSVPTGDDMLLMHKIWKQQPSNVFYLKSKDAVVRTQPAQSWKAFFNQRRRWASKTLVYDDRRIIAVLGFVLLFNLLPVLLLAAGFVHPTCFLSLLIFLLAKALIEWPFVSSVAAFFDEQKRMRYFFLLQPLHVFYTVLVGVWSQFGTYEWKGRAHPTPSGRRAQV